MKAQFQNLNHLKSIKDANYTILHELGIYNISDLLSYHAFRYARFVVAAYEGILHKDDILNYLNDGNIKSQNIDEIIMSSIHNIKGVGDEISRKLNSLEIKTIHDAAIYPPFVEAQKIVDNALIEENDPFSPECVLPKCKVFTKNCKNYVSFYKEQEINDLNLGIYNSNVSFSPLKKLFQFTHYESPKIYLGHSISFRQDWTYGGVHLGEPVGSVPLFMGQDTRVSRIDWQRINTAIRTEDTEVAERLHSILTHQRAVDEVARATAEEHQHGGTSMFTANAGTAGSFVAAGAVVGGVGGGITGAVAGLVLGNVANAAGGAPTIAGTVAGVAVGSAAGAAAGSLIYSGASTLGFIESDVEGDRNIYATSAQKIQERTVQNSSSIRSFWSNIISETTEKESQEIETSRVTNHNKIHALNAMYFEVLNEYKVDIMATDYAATIFIPYKPLTFNYSLLENYWWAIKKHIDDKELVSLVNEFLINSDFSNEASQDLEDMPAINDIVSEKLVVKLNLDGNMMKSLIEVAAYGVIGALTNFYEGIKKENIKVWIQTSTGEEYSLEQTSAANLDANYIGVFETSNEIPIHSIDKICVKNGNSEAPFDMNKLCFENITIGVDIKNKYQYLEHLPNIGEIELTQSLISETIVIKGNNTKKIDCGLSDKLSAQFEGLNSQIEDFEELLENQTEVESRINRLLGFMNANKYTFTRLILQETEKDQLSNILDNVSIAGKYLNAIADVNPIGITGNHVVLRLKKPTHGVVPRMIDPGKYSYPLKNYCLQFDMLDTKNNDEVNEYSKNLLSEIEKFSKNIQIKKDTSLDETMLLEKLENLASELSTSSSISKTKTLTNAIEKQSDNLKSKYFNEYISKIRHLLTDLKSHLDKQFFFPIYNSQLEKILTHYNEVKSSFEGQMNEIISSDTVSLPSPAIFMEPVLSQSKGAELYDMRRNSHYDLLPSPEIGEADPNVDRSEHIELTPNIPQANLSIINPPQYPLPSSINNAISEAGKLDLSTLLSTNASTLSSALTDLSAFATELAKASSQLTGDAQTQALSTAGDVAKQIGSIIEDTLKSASTPQSSEKTKADQIPPKDQRVPAPNTQQEKAEVRREVDRINNGDDSQSEKDEQKDTVRPPNSNHKWDDPFFE